MSAEYSLSLFNDIRARAYIRVEKGCSGGVGDCADDHYGTL